jgi:hypothetical protein
VSSSSITSDFPISSLSDLIGHPPPITRKSILLTATGLLLPLLLVKATVISEPVKHSLVIACSRSVAKMSLHNNSEEEDKMHYPRTGKRGVPQQFPRKLYEMLEVESGSDCVSWTASGRGFRITNTSLFSERVLPKWFKVQNIGHTTLVCFICWHVTQQHITSVTHTCQDV